ncbi:MAG: hypothetical protein HC886_08390 [Leptolyngbyaceae cyanobacterium SM1_1_3]|nr:hypothetical protein [Leptolyngbyaceae cyanobacterium SM1_1_3]NJO08819.1 hypothetical protein [Leptolyngbyaceae cyanobacterium SL_1_1]
MRFTLLQFILKVNTPFIPIGCPHGLAIYVKPWWPDSRDQNTNGQRAAEPP